MADTAEQDEEETEMAVHKEGEPAQGSSRIITVGAPTSKKKQKRLPPPLWTDVPGMNSVKQPIIWSDSLPEDNEVDTPIDYFREIIDDNFINLIVEQSNLYSVQKDPNKPLNVTKEEIEQFFGICLCMSVYGLPRSRMYWASSTRVDKVADTMSRNRWVEIKNNLHCNDNAGYDSRDPSRDRLYKIRPLVDHFQGKFRAIPKEQHLCVDEQIVPYKGTSRLRQYNPKKPKKWGYKIFALCDTHGMVYDFEIYTGKINVVDGFPDIGASSNIVLKLAHTIPRQRNYLLFFDNWFASLPLFIELYKLGIPALGTIRPNRFPGLECSSDKEMKTMGRGSFEEKSHMAGDVEVRAIKWFDNRGVTLVSTFETALPVTMIKRRDRALGQDIELPCPNAVVTYNKFMGGVDLLDGLIAYYRITIKSKKFYLKFIFHFFDVTVVNSWLLYRRHCREHNTPKKDVYDLLAFKCNIFECLLKQGKGGGGKKRGRPSVDQVQQEYEQKKKRGPTKPIPEFNIRRDGVGHWPVITDDRQRCRFPKCVGITNVKCNKCNVHLCFTKNRNCYSSSFHA